MSIDWSSAPRQWTVKALKLAMGLSDEELRQMTAEVNVWLTKINPEYSLETKESQDAAQSFAENFLKPAFSNLFGRMQAGKLADAAPYGIVRLQVERRKAQKRKVKIERRETEHTLPLSSQELRPNVQPSIPNDPDGFVWIRFSLHNGHNPSDSEYMTISLDEILGNCPDNASRATSNLVRYASLKEAFARLAERELLDGEPKTIIPSVVPPNGGKVTKDFMLRDAIRWMLQVRHPIEFYIVNGQYSPSSYYIIESLEPTFLVSDKYLIERLLKPADTFSSTRLPTRSRTGSIASPAQSVLSEVKAYVIEKNAGSRKRKVLVVRATGDRKSQLIALMSQNRNSSKHLSNFSSGSKDGSGKFS